jgi:hypothetical protein
MPSNNLVSVPSAKMVPDNQQERLITIGWTVGYVDGEGCFSVSFIKNATTKSGWQIFPEFVVTQGERSKASLEKLQHFFGCGKIFVNRRKDNHRENIYRYCVRNQEELREKIVPFFLQYQLQTAKKEDFQRFVIILQLMKEKKHLSLQGMKRIAELVQKMNHKKASRFLESSETKR